MFMDFIDATQDLNSEQLMQPRLTDCLHSSLEYQTSNKDSYSGLVKTEICENQHVSDFVSGYPQINSLNHFSQTC